MTDKNAAGRLLAFLGLALAAALLALFAEYDMAVDNALYDAGARWPYFFRVWGILLTALPVVALMGFDLVKKGRAALPDITATVVNGLLFVALEQATVNSIKLLWGRMRYAEMIAAGSFEGFTPWYLPQGYTGSTSFPSGHAAFTCIVFLVYCYALRRGRGKAIAFTGSAAYLCVMGVSRIVLGRHFPSDIVAGALVGGLCLWAAWRLTPRPAAWVQHKVDKALAARDRKKREEKAA